MAMMNIMITRAAEKDLSKIDKTVRLKVIEKLEIYARDQAALANQVKRLKGDPFLRLRVGDYRVIFTEEGVVLTVLRVGHRRKIYKH